MNDDDFNAVKELLQDMLNQTGSKIVGPKFVDLNNHGNPKCTQENFQALLDYYKIVIRWNEMSKDIEIDIPNTVFSADTRLNAQITYLESLAIRHNIGHNKIVKYIDFVGNQNSYHPVREWMDQLVWDGQDRLPQVYDMFELSEPNPMKETILRKWCLSLVAALYSPNFSCEGTLTLAGDQGVGKTTMIEQFIPQQYRNIWNKDAVVIDVKNKDSLLKALAFWITELGELDATFKKSDIESLKGFLTEKVDILRPPYATKHNSYPRRTVFYATVNEQEFLQDTENRRFWVLSISGVRNTQLDVEQFWAQMHAEYQQRAPLCATPELRAKNNEWGWFMSPAERRQMSPLQASFKTVNAIEQLLDNRIAVPLVTGSMSGRLLNMLAILQECGIQYPDKRQLTEGGKWFKKHGFTRDWNKRYMVDIRPKDDLFENNNVATLKFKK